MCAAVSCISHGMLLLLRECTLHVNSRCSSVRRTKKSETLSRSGACTSAFILGTAGASSSRARRRPCACRRRAWMRERWRCRARSRCGGLRVVGRSRHGGLHKWTRGLGSKAGRCRWTWRACRCYSPGLMKIKSEVCMRIDAHAEGVQQSNASELSCLPWLQAETVAVSGYMAYSRMHDINIECYCSIARVQVVF